MKKRLKGLETELVAVRADHDRLEERLDAVELSSAIVVRDHEQRAVQVEGRPRLKVIRLAPEHSEPAPRSAPETPPSTAPDAPAAEEERPIIRGTGDNVVRSGATSAHPEDADPNRPVIAVRGNSTADTRRRSE
jgi:hypothetical protein